MDLVHRYLPPLLRSVLILSASVWAGSGVRAQTPAPAAGEATVAPFAPAPASATLKDTFRDDFLIGVALNPRQFGGEDERTTTLISREFNCATAENAMKWDSLEPRNNVFRFAQADQFIDFCRQHDLVAIGHNLCWHAQLPWWVSRPDPGQDKLTKEVLLARLKNHITTVAAHFKGKVRGWDVVNEAIADGTGKYRDSVFLKVIGPEYLVLAFKWAHEADPGAELYYNDYNLDADDAKRARAVELVKYLRDQGARIDGIGLQGHYNLTTPTAAKIDETIRMFADLGLKVMITELDVEAIRSEHISGAVTAATGPRPRFFPTIETLKSKLALTDAQAAQIAPVLEKATTEVDAAFAARDFSRLGEIRGESSDVISRLLTAAQQDPFMDLMSQPPGGRPVGPPPPALTPGEQQALAQRYADIFDVLLKHRASITRVTFWGLDDGTSWRRRSSPLLFDEHLERKPAYDAVIATAKKAGQ